MPAFFVPTDTLPNGTHLGCITDTFDYKDGRLRSAVGTDTEHLFPQTPDGGNRAGIKVDRRATLRNSSDRSAAAV